MGRSARWQGLTDSELEILVVLWNEGPATVREVYDKIPKTREKRYTTVLKMLQLMHEKGLVKRDETARAHVYSAAIPADRARQGLARDLLDRVFGGSAKALILSALGTDHHPKRLAEIEKLLDEIEEKKT